MTPAARRSWRNAITGITAVAGLLFALFGAVNNYLGITKSVSPAAVNNAILAMLSALLLYVLLDSIRHESSLDDLAREVNDIKHDKVRGTNLEAVILERVDEKLQPMFRKHLRSVFAEISEAYESQTVEFSDPLLFKSYYLAVLEAFPHQATLMATSLPLKRYFWDGNIEGRMAQFIKRRGRKRVKFKRVFFVSRQAFEDVSLLSEEQVDVIRKQLDAGVEVYIHPCDKMPKVMVLSDEDATIAWVVRTNSDYTIRKITATSKPSIVQVHHESLKNALLVAKPIKAEHLRSQSVLS